MIELIGGPHDGAKTKPGHDKVGDEIHLFRGSDAWVYRFDGVRYVFVGWMMRWGKETQEFLETTTIADVTGGNNVAAS